MFPSSFVYIRRSLVSASFLELCADCQRVTKPVGETASTFTYCAMLLLFVVFFLSLPRDRSLPAQPISIRKTQSRKRKPTNLCAPREYLKQICRPRLKSENLIILCSLRAQRITGFFYLNYPQINGVRKPFAWY